MFRANTVTTCKVKNIDFTDIRLFNKLNVYKFYGHRLKVLYTGKNDEAKHTFNNWFYNHSPSLNTYPKKNYIFFVLTVNGIIFFTVILTTLILLKY